MLIQSSTDKIHQIERRPNKQAFGPHDGDLYQNPAATHSKKEEVPRVRMASPINVEFGNQNEGNPLQSSLLEGSNNNLMNSYLNASSSLQNSQT